MIKQIAISLPLPFIIGTFIYFFAIFAPKMFNFSFIGYDGNGLPSYFLLYYIYATHFFFPRELRKYHGAEHKIFSYKGHKGNIYIDQIKKASITNRYCSTNGVVLFFTLLAIISMICMMFVSFQHAIEIASYVAFIMTALFSKWFVNLLYIGNCIRSLSYYLQQKVTTLEPDDFHIKLAIQSYRQLLRKEFPSQLSSKRKERSKVAIIDVTIIPIGTASTSVSEYVAEIHQVLKGYEDKIRYQLTPMSTIIEGEIPVLFEVIQALHEVPFTKGVKRVATNIRIDDRRDQANTMVKKMKSVEEKLEIQTNANS